MKNDSHQIFTRKKKVRKKKVKNKSMKDKFFFINKKLWIYI